MFGIPTNPFGSNSYSNFVTSTNTSQENVIAAQQFSYSQSQMSVSTTPGDGRYFQSQTSINIAEKRHVEQTIDLTNAASLSIPNPRYIAIPQPSTPAIQTNSSQYHQPAPSSEPSISAENVQLYRQHVQRHLAVTAFPLHAPTVSTAMFQEQQAKRFRRQAIEDDDEQFLGALQSREQDMLDAQKAITLEITELSDQLSSFRKISSAAITDPTNTITNRTTSQGPLPSEILDACHTIKSASNASTTALDETNTEELYLVKQLEKKLAELVIVAENKMDTIANSIKASSLPLQYVFTLQKSLSSVRDVLSDFNDFIMTIPDQFFIVLLKCTAARVRVLTAQQENTKGSLETALQLVEKTLQAVHTYQEDNGTSTEGANDENTSSGSASISVSPEYIMVQELNKTILDKLEEIAGKASAAELAALTKRRQQTEGQDRMRKEIEQQRRAIAEDSPIMRLKKTSESIYPQILGLFNSINESADQTIQRIRKEIKFECTKSLNRLSATTQSVQQCLHNVSNVWKHWQNGVPNVGISGEQLTSFILYTCAELLVRAGDTVPGIIYAKATFAHAFAGIDPRFPDIFIALLGCHCPVAVGRYPVSKTGVSFKKELGYAVLDGVLETTPQFLERLTAYLSLYFAWLHVRCSEQSEKGAEAKGQLWGWVASTLNAPIGPQTTTAILSMLRFAGYAFCMSFQKQSRKIYNVLVQLFQEMETLSAVSLGGPEGKTAMMNISAELDGWRAKGTVTLNPASHIARSQQSTVQLERISDEDRNAYS